MSYHGLFSKLFEKHGRTKENTVPRDNEIFSTAGNFIVANVLWHRDAA